LHAARCPLPVARCPLQVACCSLHIARCMAHVVWMLSVACCVSSVAFSPLHVACHLFSVAQFPVVSCTLSLSCRLLHVLRCMVSVFGCPPQCPLSHAVVSCQFPVPSRISSVACAALRVVGCMLHNAVTFPVAWCLLSVARPILHVVRRMPCVACCRVTQRRGARSASRRRSKLRASVAGETRADGGVRACMRARVRVGSNRDGVSSLWVAVRA
jgi:hypothetical protein